MVGGIGKGIVSFIKKDVIGGVKGIYNLVKHPIQTGKGLIKEVENINSVIKNPDAVIKSFDSEKVSGLILNTFGTSDGLLDFQQNKIAVETRINLNIIVDVLIGQGLVKSTKKTKIPEPPRIQVDIDKGVNSTVKYSPINPGPLKKSVAESFSGATYKETVLTQDTILYRVYGGDSGKVGSYMTRIRQNGGMQSQIDLALNPQWGNTAQNVTKVTVPRGTVIYEGTAASQTINGGAGQLIGGGNQIYIPEVNASWFK